MGPAVGGLLVTEIGLNWFEGGVGQTPGGMASKRGRTSLLLGSRTKLLTDEGSRSFQEDRLVARRRDASLRPLPMKTISVTLRTMTYSLKQIRRSSHMLFRMDSGNFIYLGNKLSKQNAVKAAEIIRNEIKTSKKFIEEMSVSIGVVHYSDIQPLQTKHSLDSEHMYKVALLRLSIAKNRGGDIVVGDTDIMDIEYNGGKILIVDEDVTNTSVLKAYLNNKEYNVITASNGEEAAEIAIKELPELIISEIMLPKMDGFLLKEKLSLESATKNIPFVLLSNLKNDDSVKRAFSLGIEHYIKKPYMISEILGIVDIKLRREQR